MATATIESFTVKVHWHETRGPYNDTIRYRDFTRMVQVLREVVRDHDIYGRIFTVIAHHTDGTTAELSNADIAKLP